MALLTDRRGRRILPPRLHATHEAAHAISAVALRIPLTAVTMADAAGDGGGGSAIITVPHFLLPYLLHRKPPREIHAPARRREIARHLVQTVAGFAGERELVRAGRLPEMWSFSEPGSDAEHAAILARLLGARGRNVRPFVATELEARPHAPPSPAARCAR
ncbi:MAG: hypothetical protein JOZ69_05040 [Myxococcales bacterium]|nr:hypothetical protein [Myxococcales bacterium]